MKLVKVGLILSILLAGNLALSAAIPTAQRQALLDLYNSTNGASWTTNTHWGEAAGTENTWFGVTTDAGNTMVLMISLAGNNLVGALPASLGSLINLEELRLSGNGLTGSIPTELGSLTNLQRLYLNSNALSGGLPVSLGSLSNLLEMELQNNPLTGSIPSSFGNLNKLTRLVLYTDQLSGSIPTELGNMSSLTYLHLADNALTGSLPASLGNLGNLEYLFLSLNQLTGNIPSELGSLSKLHNLTLGSNQLTGTIPASLGNLSSLASLSLNSNLFTGSIPTQLGNLINLYVLALHSNQLTGSIPAELGNLLNLQQLTLNSNKLMGNIPTSLANLTSLNAASTNIGYNELHTSDAALITFLNSKDPDWATTQTIAPTNITAVPGIASALVSWTPIAYTGDAGGYRVLYGTVAGGPYTFYAQTANKSASSQLVSGLTPGIPYYFVVQTRTDAHANNLNIVDSENSDEATATPAIPPSITVTSPNGAESWVVGSAHNITWTSTGTIANVKIEYSTNSGSSYTTVIASTTNTGSYGWTIPNTPAATCLVRVSDAANAATNDVSNAVFTIDAIPTLTVTSPNGAESWVVGSAHNITWTATGTIANVKIEYSTNSGSSYTTVIASTGNTGSYGWTIPNTPAATCLVRVSDAANAATNDVSNAVFTIDAIPTLTVTSPNGAESWVVGSAHNITWTSTGTIANVKIEYSTNSGSSYTTVIASTTNTGSYGWTIPNTPAATCLVRVSNAANAATNDVSNAVFTIDAIPTLTVTSPNGAESWVVGSAHNITWTATGTIANVKIEYSTNSGSSYTTVIASTGNTGSYGWTIPNTPAATCLVRVSDAANAATNDVSNAVFTIDAIPTLTVTSPNGAESWVVGSAHNITWTATGTIANVKIEYSTNSGSSYTTVIASTGNTGSYGWTIPNTPAATCLVRVSNAANAATNDVSNAVFTIDAIPTLTVTSPNGAESWVVGSAHNITWTATGTIANVKIEYSTNSGSSYTTVIASTGNTGSYGWTIPNTPAATCLVRVSDVLNAATNDISDGTFAIKGSALQRKVDFNGDGKEDLLWRYYSSGGYNVVWFLGGVGSAGLRPLPWIDSPINTNTAENKHFKNDGSKIGYWDARDAGSSENHDEILRLKDPREFSGNLNSNAPVLSDPRNVKPLNSERDVLFSPLSFIDPRQVPSTNNFEASAVSIVLGSADLPSVGDLNWKIVGTGDFNGDGKVDILWRYNGSSGYNCVWFMDGTTVLGGVDLPSVADSNWQIQGTGDFNGDGKVDILWRYGGSSGYNCVWFMNGTTVLGGVDLPSVADSNWQIQGTGDFNGDGNVDILWRYGGSNGYNCVWFMNGTTVLGGVDLPSVADSNWQIQGTGDFNGDGKVDILWRYYGSGGYNTVWLMNGTAILGGSDIPACSELNWKIVNR